MANGFLDSVGLEYLWDKIEERVDGSGKRTARFVIGAKTAGWTAADVDYLCDGTADDVEINAAIQALPSTGGEIIILDGTYNITADINVNKNNVTLSGNGQSTILKRMYDVPSESGLIHVTSSNNTIQNLTIDGNKTEYSSTKNVGIFMKASHDNIIVRNKCVNNGSNGIFMNSASTDNIVIGNTCNNNYRGIGLNSSNNSVIGNSCNNNRDKGIYLSGSIENTIIGNVCNSNANGIGLSSSSSNTITGNVCNDNTIGIRLETADDNSIIGNTCCNDTHGIFLVSSTKNTITGNVCNDNTHGIYLNSSTKNTITGNVYNDNTSSISMYGSYTNTITGNTCINSNSGIYLASSSNGNTIDGNTCIRGTGLTSDYTSEQYTIYIASGSGNLIAGNNILGKNYVDSGTGNTWADNKYQ